jgi:hypothetical protein
MLPAPQKKSKQAQKKLSFSNEKITAKAPV